MLRADGKSYKGPVAGGAKISSPIRQISTTSPWKDPNGAGITCGRNPKNAALVAPVTAGSVVELSWEDHPGTNWQHDMGPLITYMAKVGRGSYSFETFLSDCWSLRFRQVPTGQTADKFDATQANFFKISQAGQTGNTWVQASLSEGAYILLFCPALRY